MKILIVDDNNDKIQEIINSFPEHIRDSIDTAESSGSAQCFFSKCIYDLAIIDLALPRRDKEKPIENEGVELIQSINEFDWFKKPKKVLAITQYDNLEKQYTEKLKEFGVTLHHYDGTNNIQEIISYQYSLLTKSKEQIEFLFDIVIVVALEEEAMPLINDPVFQWDEKKHFGLDDVGIRTCKYRIEDKYFQLALVILPRMGLVTSAITTTRVVNFLKPKYIIMPGICAGIKSEVGVGDLIVANPSWEWQTGKWKGENFAIEPYQLTVDQSLIRLVNELANTNVLSRIWSETESKRPEYKPKLHIGPVVSGSSVISNEKMMGELKTQHRKLLGLEMEIFGVYAACINSHIKPQFIAFKSVCDFGNEEKEDGYHKFCCEISAIFCKEFIKKILINM